MYAASMLVLLSSVAWNAPPVEGNIDLLNKRSMPINGCLTSFHRARFMPLWYATGSNQS